MFTSSSSDFQSRIIAPKLDVKSGVYAAVVPDLAMALDDFGEYDYVDKSFTEDNELTYSLLRLSAFGGTGPSEDAISSELFPVGGRIKTDPIIGNYVGLYAGYVEEGDYRKNGSSGGLTTWLLQELLNRGDVDAVIHIKQNESSSVLFDYRISVSSEEVAAGSKSRYYPANLSEVLKVIATSDKKYAITAIPSFAYEIRLLQHISPEFKARIPFVLGLICGHQKTANYSKQLAWRTGIHPDDLSAIDFRKKDLTTTANRYRAEIESSVNGFRTYKTLPQGEAIETDWGMGLFKSNFSDYTEDAFNETADSVFGDAWLKPFVDDPQGTNVLITRNPLIDDIFQSAAASGRIHLQKLSTEQVLSSQSALVKHTVYEIHARFDYLKERGEYVPSLRRTRPASKLSASRVKLQQARLKLSRLSHSAWLDAYKQNSPEKFDDTISVSVSEYINHRDRANRGSITQRVIRKLKSKLN